MLPSHILGSSISLSVKRSMNQLRTSNNTWTSHCTWLKSCWLVLQLMIAVKTVKISHQPNHGSPSQSHRTQTRSQAQARDGGYQAGIRVAMARHTWGVPDAKCFSASPKEEHASRIITNKTSKGTAELLIFTVQLNTQAAVVLQAVEHDPEPWRLVSGSN